jgi:hypothetical protein
LSSSGTIGQCPERHRRRGDDQGGRCGSHPASALSGWIEYSRDQSAVASRAPGDPAGAFEHAVPLRRWRSEWPPVYETLLTELRQRWPDGRGLREFLAILKLHDSHAPEALVGAIQAALNLGAVHLDGVRLCLRQLTANEEPAVLLDLSDKPTLARIGEQPVNLYQYDTLLVANQAAPDRRC